MKLIVGLGNPGKKYSKTRHNAGFMVIDALVSKTQEDSLKFKINKKLHCSLFIVHRSLVLAKPTTYMNNSGAAVKSLYTKYNIQNSDLYVMHDDLDIPLGRYKIQFAKGPRVHNGLLSIYEKLGSRDFWHVRIGVENREVGNKVPGEDYVLQQFSDKEFIVVKEVIDKVTFELRGKLME